MRRVRDQQCVAISHLQPLAITATVTSCLVSRHSCHLTAPTVAGERRMRGQGSLAFPPNTIFAPLLIVQFNKFDSVMNKLSPPASPNFHLVEFISRAARQARLLIQTTTFSFELQVCTSRPLSPFLAAFNRPVLRVGTVCLWGGGRQMRGMQMRMLWPTKRMMSWPMDHGSLCSLKRTIIVDQRWRMKDQYGASD